MGLVFLMAHLIFTFVFVLDRSKLIAIGVLTTILLILITLCTRY
jgi:hypothetical protein